MTAARGPVSAALEADLRARLGAHHLVLWPDRPAHFTGFVDRLISRRDAGDLGFDVVAYRGSFLELMLALEPRVGAADVPLLLVHLPGFDEEAARGTPLLELLEVGHVFHDRLPDIVAAAAAEKVPPAAISALVARDDLRLEDADHWLALRLEGQHAGQLGQLHALRLPAVVDDLLRPDTHSSLFGAMVADPAELPKLLGFLAARAGLSDAWRDATLPPRPAPADVAFTVAGWALCVEYTDDLAREPADERLRAMGGLLRPVVEACCELAAHLRARGDDFYRRTADDTERRLATEVESARAEDLGRIDTFRFEEEKVLAAALAALAARQWDVAAEWAALRLAGPSFWLRVDPPRELAWQLVQDTAALGQALSAAGPRLAAHDLESAVARYTEHGAAVDRAHRHLERRRGAISTTTPYYERLRDRLDDARKLWTTWADAWARDFSDLCRGHGFLPGRALQQRWLFDDVLKPLAREQGTTALFVVDALRYELAAELFATFDAGPATTAQLRARLAELPTVTEVGMNVLAPVVTPAGRLRPIVGEKKIKGFHSGEYTVADPGTRHRAMLQRIGGPRGPWIPLDKVTGRDLDALRNTIRGAHFVVVHSREIDDLGEADTAFVSLAAFDTVLHRLRAAWATLREAGVRRFVITSDHGFLLLSDPARTPHGRRIDPRQRCMLRSVGADEHGSVRVALADLGYEDTAAHLFMPETTAVYDTGQRPSFVHGGNSLQERVIPVITLVHHTAVGGTLARYRVTLEPREPVTDMHALKLRVLPDDQAGLGFTHPDAIELTVRVPEAPDVAVELCSVRGARSSVSTIYAPVDRDVELFFRLRGPADARVQVEVHHPTLVAAVEPARTSDRYDVLAAGAPRPAAPPPEPPPPESPRTEPPRTESPRTSSAPPQPPPPPRRSWLDDLEDRGVREFFAHLAAHGEVSEADAATMLGGPRQLRMFSLKFKEHAARAPFIVRIETSGGLRRYLREGNPA